MNSRYSASGPLALPLPRKHKREAFGLPFIFGAGDRDRFAFSPGNGRKSRMRSVEPSRATVLRTVALDGFDPFPRTKHKREAFGLPFIFGAGDRDRTGTLFTARDFKSLVSAYSTTPAVGTGLS